MPSKDRRTGPDKDTTALRARPYPGHPGSLPNRKVGWPRSAGLGSAAAWPVVARAQQGDRMRRIGVLMAYDENDPLAKAFVSAFIQAPADLGWTDGRNVQIDIRWHGDDNNRIRALAQELIGLQPDIILTYATPATVTVQRETRTIDPNCLCECGRTHRHWHRRAA